MIIFCEKIEHVNSFYRKIAAFVKPDNSVMEVIRKNNIQRIIYFSFLAVPLNIIHIVIFYLNLGQPGTMEYIWRIGIIGCHLFSVILFLSITVSLYIQRKREKLNPVLIERLFVFVFSAMIFLGVVIVSFDQIVTPAITPFFILCAIMSLVVLIPPVYSITVFIISFVLFNVGISIFQKNPDELLSNRVNALTAVSLGILLSIIIWKNIVTRIRQQNIIESQKKILENSLSELMMKSKELQEVNASKDKLLGVIAHDLTAPFNLITGFTGFLKENIHDYSVEQIELYLGDINNAALRAQSLLFELLTWARLQTGNLIFNKQSFDLLSVYKKIAESALPLSSAKKISITENIEEGVTLFADIEMTKTILRNLITNSIKFCHENGTILVSGIKQGDFALITVEDNGVGISPENMKSLFSGFPSNSSPGTSNEQGSGLGLMLCSEFVGKHDGKIWAESEMNKFTKIFFTLPLSSAENS